MPLETSLPLAQLTSAEQAWRTKCTLRLTVEGRPEHVGQGSLSLLSTLPRAGGDTLNCFFLPNRVLFVDRISFARECFLCHFLALVSTLTPSSRSFVTG